MNTNRMSGSGENTHLEKNNFKTTDNIFEHSFPQRHEWVTDDSFTGETFVAIECMADAVITYSDGFTTHSTKTLVAGQRILGQNLTNLDVDSGTVVAYYKTV